jgi:hypothetical protein
VQLQQQVEKLGWSLAAGKKFIAAEIADLEGVAASGRAGRKEGAEAAVFVMNQTLCV